MNEQFENQNKINKQKKKIFLNIIVLFAVIISACVLFLIIIKQNEKQNIKEQILENQEIVKEFKEEVIQNNNILVRYGKMFLAVNENSIQKGDEIEVEILMDTQKSNIVLASAIIGFDNGYLEFIDQSKTKESVLKMAVVDNFKDNKIEIVRGAPGDTNYLDEDDGYNGSNGILAILKFKALKSGSTQIYFDNICQLAEDRNEEICDESSMILDDGNGTLMNVEFQDLNLEIYPVK